MVKLNSLSIGIGTDCVEVSRFENRGEEFFKKIFTHDEISYCESKGKPIQHYAARFAGKEAVIKAISEFENITTKLKSIEILNDALGKPYVKLVGDIPDSYDIKISLSHSNNTAIAMVIVYAA